MWIYFPSWGELIMKWHADCIFKIFGQQISSPFVGPWSLTQVTLPGGTSKPCWGRDAWSWQTSLVESAYQRLLICNWFDLARELQGISFSGENSSTQLKLESIKGKRFSASNAAPHNSIDKSSLPIFYSYLWLFVPNPTECPYCIVPYCIVLR